MLFLHAAYSGGAVVGALGTGALLWAGLDYRLIYLGLLIPLTVVVAAVAAAPLPRPGGASGSNVSRGRRGERRHGAPGPLRSAPLLLVAAVAALGLLAEGEMGHWSGIYLRDSLGLSALLGGSGVAVFYGAMALGRLVAGWVVGHLGNRTTLLGAGLLAAFGMTLALATIAPALVVGGFLLVGLVLAAIVPLAFSVAGDLMPERAGTAIAVVTSHAST